MSRGERKRRREVKRKGAKGERDGVKGREIKERKRDTI